MVRRTNKGESFGNFIKIGKKNKPLGKPMLSLLLAVILLVGSFSMLGNLAVFADEDTSCTHVHEKECWNTDEDVLICAHSECKIGEQCSLTLNEDVTEEPEESDNTSESIDVEDEDIGTGVMVAALGILESMDEISLLGGTNLYIVYEDGTPIGSYDTMREAVTVCVINGKEYTIEATGNDNDMDSNVITVAAGKKITLTSSVGEQFTVSQINIERHFIVEGSLTLKNIILDGNDTGGGVMINGGTLTMGTNSIITDCSANIGGGVYVWANSTFTMNDNSAVTQNNATTYGGGVYNLGTFTMNGTSSVSNNTSLSTAGGAYNHSTFTMNGSSSVNGNKATAEGGGVQNDSLAVITVNSGASVKNNTAKRGGGIYSDGLVNIVGGIISDNTAIENGGGIYMDLEDYNKLTVAVGSVFSNNKAAEFSMNLRLDKSSVYNSKIFGTTWTEPFIQGYNNFDINSSNKPIVGLPVQPRYIVVRDSDSLQIGRYFWLADAVDDCIVGEVCTITALTNDLDVTDYNNKAGSAGFSNFPLGLSTSGLGDSYISIPANKVITIISNAVGPYTIVKQGTNRHFIVDGNLTLSNIILDGNSECGGVQVNNTGSLTMKIGSVITNCSNPVSGGGVNVWDTGKLEMLDNATISNCEAAEGGGVATSNYSNVTVAGAVVFSNNKASSYAIEINPTVKTIYDSNILGKTWTVPFTQGYNNFDISSNFNTIPGLPAITRYIVTKDTDPSTVIGRYYWLADAVDSCIISDAYTITATTNDPDVTDLGDKAGKLATPNFVGTVTSGSTDAVITIPVGKKITLTSDKFGPYTITTLSTNRHFIAIGNLTLENIILDGNGTATLGGGVQVHSTGTLIMNNGSVIQNCYALLGGGVDIYITGGKTFMYGNSSIRNNKSTKGGGVYNLGLFEMHDSASITNNIAPEGGGVAIITSVGLGTNVGNFKMFDNSKISNNTGDLGTSNSSIGGGVYVQANSLFTMNNNASVTENKAKDGGGIWSELGIVTINSGSITNNEATRNGGGIYTSDYNSLSVAAGVIFSNNKAAEYSMNRNPIYNAVYLSNIKTTSWTAPFTQGYNNYDINSAYELTPGKPVTPRYIVIKDTGSVEIARYYWLADAVDACGLDGAYTIVAIVNDLDVTDYGNKAGSTSVPYFSRIMITSSGKPSSNIEIPSNKTITITSNSSGKYTITKIGTSRHFIVNGSLTLTNITLDGSLSNGGLQVNNGGTLTLKTNSTIQNCYNQTSGGGVEVWTTGKLNMTDTASISSNKSGYIGGGVHNLGIFNISGTASITNNTAIGDGGGIYTNSYANLTIANGAIFSNNKAATYTFNHDPGVDDIYMKNILSKSWTAPFIQGYNNYDINHNYTNSSDFYRVTYDANGGYNTPTDLNSYPLNSTVTVAGSSGIARNNHSLVGWNTEANGSGTFYASGATFIIKSNITLYAQWKENTVVVTTYTVRYLPGTRGTFSIQTTSGLVYGTATPTAPMATGLVGYTFIGWSPARSTVVTGNVDYIAQWTAATYTVRFVNFDGRLLKSEQVVSGGNASAPTVPERTGYRFTGWDREYTNVTANITVTAQFDNSVTPISTSYSVQFLDYDGRVLKTEQVVAGGNATAPANPTRSGYTFTSWDRAFTNVTSDITVTAQYRENNTGTNTTDVNDTVIEITRDYTPEEVFKQIISEDIPLITIGGTTIPLAPGSMNGYVWALTNLVLAIAGIIVMVITIIRTAIQKKKENDTTDDYLIDNDQKKNRMGWIATTIIMGIGGAALFLITEDISKLMVVVDRWTIVNAVILAIEILASILIFKRGKNSPDNEEYSLNSF